MRKRAALRTDVAASLLRGLRDLSCLTNDTDSSVHASRTIFPNGKDV